MHLHISILYLHNHYHHRGRRRLLRHCERFVHQQQIGADVDNDITTTTTTEGEAPLLLPCVNQHHRHRHRVPMTTLVDSTMTQCPVEHRTFPRLASMIYRNDDG